MVSLQLTVINRDGSRTKVNVSQSLIPVPITMVRVCLIRTNPNLDSESDMFNYHELDNPNHIIWTHNPTNPPSITMVVGILRVCLIRTNPNLDSEPDLFNYHVLDNTNHVS